VCARHWPCYAYHRQVRDERMGISFNGSSLYLFLSDTIATVSDVLCNCRGEQNRFLADDADIPPEPLDVQFSSVDVVNANSATQWVVEPLQQLNYCAFATSTRTNKSNCLTFHNSNVQAVCHLAKQNCTLDRIANFQQSRYVSAVVLEYSTDSLEDKKLCPLLRGFWTWPWLYIECVWLCGRVVTVAVSHPRGSGFDSQSMQTLLMLPSFRGW